MKTKKPSELLKVYESIGAAAAALNLPFAALSRAKRQGCPAFRSNRVHVAELRDWLKTHPLPKLAEADTLRDKKLAQEVLKLTLANQARQGELIERVFVAAAMQRAGGELHTLRARSEAEHPLLFAAACPGADVAACRTILRGIWSDVFSMVQGLGKHFQEPPENDSAVLKS